LGVTYGKLENYQKAADCFEKAIKIDPEDSVTWYNLATSYYEFDSQKATKCFERAVKINPDLSEEAWHYMGVCYGELKKYQKAADCFGKAVNIDPENSENWFLMGRCYLLLENFQKAMECL
jgi:tetratricopeptide (TPR) repeat protein